MRKCDCGKCRLCWLWDHSPKYRQFWGGESTPEIEVFKSLPPIESGHHSPTRQCKFLGEELTIGEKKEHGLSLSKSWALCENENLPLGKFVCPCAGCGKKCAGYNPEQVKYTHDWAYGLTTFPGRRDTTLPRTLESLEKGGFPKPRLFIDGGGGGDFAKKFGCSATVREPAITPYANWVLGLWELWTRYPTADRFVMFQDDFVCYKNLREYLDRCELAEKTYWNLYTFPVNQLLAPLEDEITGVGTNRWFRSNQAGKGAVGLVFSRQGVRDLLSTTHMVDRPLNPTRGKKGIDGGVVTALKKQGYTELTHTPSLVQHIGIESSIGNRRHALAESFRGEEFDALQLQIFQAKTG